MPVCMSLISEFLKQNRALVLQVGESRGIREGTQSGAACCEVFASIVILDKMEISYLVRTDS